MADRSRAGRRVPVADGGARGDGDVQGRELVGGRAGQFGERHMSATGMPVERFI